MVKMQFPHLIAVTLLAAGVVQAADVQPEDLLEPIEDVRVEFKDQDCVEDDDDVDDDACKYVYERTYEPAVEKLEALKEFNAFLEEGFGFVVNLNFEKDEENDGISFEIVAVDTEVRYCIKFNS